MVARRHPLGDPAGDEADDDEREKADARLAQERIGLVVHRRPLIITDIRTAVPVIN